jgi:hypothetical protein
MAASSCPFTEAPIVKRTLKSAMPSYGPPPPFVSSALLVTLFTLPQIPIRPFILDRTTDTIPFDVPITSSTGHAGNLKMRVKLENLPLFAQMEGGIHTDEGVSGGAKLLLCNVPVPLCITNTRK